MTAVTAYGATSSEGRFDRVTIERREPDTRDVVIRIDYCGVCHSDIHTARGEWGGITYPMVTGHEIAGVVEQVGPGVTKFAVGDRVGVGCLVDSCRECRHCLAGNEQFCSGGVGTYNGTDRYGQPTAGGYSTHITVVEDFVLRIPDALGLDVAAPLLCAGITTYSPLRHWGAGPGTRVGVMGLGGLGHMAVKFAAAMGAEVTVLSRTESKAADALDMGASRVLVTGDRASLRSARESLDLIINTVSAPIDFDAHLRLLDVNGTMVMVGLPPDDLTLKVWPLLSGRRSLSASPIGGIAETQDMLDVAAQHGFGATIETIAADEITAAHDRVVAGDVRYRYVIDIDSMR